MLQFLRKHSQSVLVWLLVGAIAFIFVVQFGPQSRGCGGQKLASEYVVKVHGYTVAPEAWRWAWVMHNGDQVQPKEAKAMRLRENVMDGLIERELLVDQAHGLGLKVTEDEVEDALLDNRLFLTSSVHAMGRMSSSGTIPIDFTRDDGSFDFETFKMFVTNRFHMTFASFKEQQMREMLAQHMRRMVEASIHVSDAEVRFEYEKTANRVKVGYVAFDPGFYIRRLQPADAEVEEWIAAHEKQVRDRYDEESYKYTNVEKQVRTSHILVKVEADAGDGQKAEKKALADRILADAQAGKDFAMLASTYSDDTMSAKQGGDIGFRSRGQLAEKYEDTAFGMKVGEIAGPVETEYGFHIIKCDGFREGNIPYEDVKDEIGRTLMLMEQAREQSRLAAQELLSKVSQGGNIIDAAEALESLYYPKPAEDPAEPETADAAEPTEEEPQDPMMPRYKESGWVGPQEDSITGIGRDATIVEKVFGLDMESPLLGEVVKVGDRFYVLQLIDSQEASDEDFAVKKPDIKRAMEGEKKIAMFTQWMDDLRAKAEAQDAIKINETYLKYALEGETETADSSQDEKAD